MRWITYVSQHGVEGEWGGEQRWKKEENTSWRTTNDNLSNTLEQQDLSLKDENVNRALENTPKRSAKGPLEVQRRYEL